MIGNHGWGVILAGGDGTRLQPLTRLISGDDRPKQFCPILAGYTLLAQTRARVGGILAPERTVFVVVAAHQRFYSPELADVEPSRIVVQPANRGTAPAIASALLRISRWDAGAAVAFFPSDHYYSDEPSLALTVRKAFHIVKDYPESILLLGAEPASPQVEYGWIEPGDALHSRHTQSLFRVSQFWEKPALGVAEALFTGGSLWNTFVMIGRVSAFLNAIRSAVPELLRSFESAAHELTPPQRLYETLACSDFSSQVLTCCKKRLAVLRLGNVGWSDLGHPERVLATLDRAGLTPAWLESHRRSESIIVSA